MPIYNTELKNDHPTGMHLLFRNNFNSISFDNMVICFVTMKTPMQQLLM